MKKIIALVWTIVFLAWVSSFSGSRSLADQGPAATFQNNSCLACHSKIDDPLVVSARYYEWQLSRHQNKAVSCDKCHGGDPAVADKDKAHAGVLRSGDPKSRLNRNNQAATCGGCHQAVTNAFVQSVHYLKLNSVGLGPSCNTCHQHMATKVVYSPKETADLCANCHNATEFLPPRPEIARQAEETMMSLQRANRAIDWATLLLAEGQRRGLSLKNERDELGQAQRWLSEAKIDWHAFNPENTRKNADNAFQKGTRVKDDLRKKILSN